MGVGDQARQEEPANRYAVLSPLSPTECSERENAMTVAAAAAPEAGA
jgi:hypothetical protein